jgi:hypothetical protein
MGRNCTICTHKLVTEVNRALAGTRTPDGLHIEAPPLAYRSVAKHFGIHPSALYRHMRFHTPGGEIKPGKARQLRSAGAFLAALETLHALVEASIDKAVEIGDLHAIARLVVAAQGLITTAARLTGELSEAAPQVAISLRWGDDGERGANVGQPVAFGAAHPPVLDAEVLRTEPEMPES